MAVYNITKYADRERLRQDRQAELDACLDESWPRNLNDFMRWSRLPGNQFLSAAEDLRMQREHVADCCRQEIQYLRNISPRIVSGELQGWEI